jgi:CheY-like chemotaxis protein
VVNARDAMPDGGRLTLSARNETIAPAADHALAAGDYVCLAVADTGTGMDDATLARATEPFFTTKGAGKGTGLGLSMVHGLAAQSGGVLRLSSRPGAGTTAELWLPRAPALPASATAAPARAAPHLPRSCTVLLVDDDALISMATGEMLKDLGHQVIEAPSGSRALEILRTGTPIDVVVSDEAMPHMRGTQLAAAIRASWPDLPVILATGYADLPKDSELKLPLLRKPYAQEDLAAAIIKALGANARPAT